MQSGDRLRPTGLRRSPAGRPEIRRPPASIQAIL